jgi:predicted nuclease with TOPRIM domain
LSADIRDIDYWYNEAQKVFLGNEKQQILNTRLAMNGDLKTVKEHIYRIDLELARLEGRKKEIIDDSWQKLKNRVKKKNKKKR